MSSVVMLIRGALGNALAFTGSSYLFHRLSKDSIDKERKRHDAAVEKKAVFKRGNSGKWHRKVYFTGRFSAVTLS